MLLASVLVLVVQGYPHPIAVLLFSMLAEAEVAVSRATQLAVLHHSEEVPEVASVLRLVSQVR